MILWAMAGDIGPREGDRLAVFGLGRQRDGEEGSCGADTEDDGLAVGVPRDGDGVEGVAIC